ncbi:OmpA family protein [Paracoccus sp. 11-3]|uniref:OmpA family protein n=2 Tax=Paracoccus amoyensis TaxID=2760093 RepID=A0A926JDD9_9RHOB|nr:OmpA family protein [Paracoccus amoyensis]
MAGVMAALAFQATPGFAQTEGPDPLKIYFQTNSRTVSDEGQETLDQAARLFRDGNPIVMIVAGGTDTVGAPEYNLQLSLDRAQAVAGQLVARGIPVDRLQVLGRGASELIVKTEDNVENPDNRVVEISWR